MQLSSWRTYENYTGPLGLQTLTDIVGNHYGVAVEASERNGWGQWHRADEKGVGMDRTSRPAPGSSASIRPAVAKHVRIARNVSRRSAAVHAPRAVHARAAVDGKTVIQHIYDSHYDGAAAVARLRPRVDDAQGPDRRRAIPAGARRSSTYQAGQAIVWRDAVSNWFFKASGIPDSKGRVGTYPGRMEAEAARLDGLRRDARHAVGNGVGRTGCRVRCGDRARRRSRTTMPPGGGI